MSIEEISKFLLDAGFKVNLDDNGLIKEIINNTTGEQLQQVRDFFGNEFHSADKKDVILLSRDITTIRQNGLEIRKKENSLTISDYETNTNISVSHFPNRHIDNLGRIQLYMKKNGQNEYLEDGFDLIQGALGAKIRSGDSKLDSIQLENENPQMYLQTIINCIKETNYIVSNPKINAKLGLIVIAAQEYVNQLVNAKYQNPERIIKGLEKRKAELANQMEKIGIEIEQYDAAISQLATAGKKM